MRGCWRPCGEEPVGVKEEGWWGLDGNVEPLSPALPEPSVSYVSEASCEESHFHL